MYLNGFGVGEFLGFNRFPRLLEAGPEHAAAVHEIRKRHGARSAKIQR